jgi:hypothetical protein
MSRPSKLTALYLSVTSVVEKANSYDCQKLNQLEGKYPAINKPTEEVST